MLAVNLNLMMKGAYLFWPPYFDRDIGYRMPFFKKEKRNNQLWHKKESFYSSLFIGKIGKGVLGLYIFLEKLDLYSLRPEKDVGSLPPSRLNKFCKKTPYSYNSSPLGSLNLKSKIRLFHGRPRPSLAVLRCRTSYVIRRLWPPPKIFTAGPHAQCRRLPHGPHLHQRHRRLAHTKSPRGGPKLCLVKKVNVFNLIKDIPPDPVAGK
jgi:hypothetical protein